MDGVVINALDFGEINAVCAFCILLFGFMSIAFMKGFKKRVSRYMILMACLYIIAIVSDIFQFTVSEGYFSLFDGPGAVFVFISIACQIIACGMWLAYVQSRTVQSAGLLKLSIAADFLVIICLLSFEIFAFFGGSSFFEWEKRMGLDGISVRLMEVIVLLLYTLAFIYPINRITRQTWAVRRRSLTMMVFPVPIIVATLLQMVSGSNYVYVGWMLSFVIYVFIRLHDIGFEKNRDLEHYVNLTDSIREDYLAIFYTDLNENTVESFFTNDYVTKEYDSFIKKGVYSEFVNHYSENTIYSPDADDFRRILSVENVREQLSKENDFTYDYRANRDGDIRYFRLHCYRVKNEKKLEHAVTTFMDVTEEKIRELTDQKNTMVFKSLSEGFEYVCYLDFGSEIAEEYYVSKSFEYFFNVIGEPDPRKRFDQIFRHGMGSEAFAEFSKRFNRNTVLEELAESGLYSAECKMNMGRGYRYYNVKAFANKANPEAAVIGIVDVNDQIRAEIEKEERIKEKEYSAQLEATIAERTAELHEKARSLNQINEDIIELLGNITEARDVESGEHIKRVKGFTNILARHIMEDYPEYGLDEAQIALITSASALHDIGKIMIPDNILRKPGKFTKEEFDIMKTHCLRGCEILEKAPQGWDEKYLNFSMEICGCHHEKWDGKGYPKGLKGDEIPISAQIVSVADCFDALTTKRVYKDAYSPNEAFDMITNGECGAFSPKIMDAFNKAKKEFLVQFDTKEEHHSSAVTVNSYALSDISILLVEDNKLTRRITSEILEEEGAKVKAVENGMEALEELSGQDADKYDVVLMDIILPDIDGWEVAKRIKNDPGAKAHDVPIIAISSNADEFTKQKALESGMVAYLTKPVSVTSLTKILIKSMRNEQDSLKKRLEEVVKRANNDPLTGVKNITAYTEAVGELTRKIANKEAIEFAIVMCDINHLKTINDTYGHQMGDKYIKNCSRIICATYAHSPVYRIGGDEFAVILTGEDFAKRNELIDDIGQRIQESSEVGSIENGRASMAVGMSVFNPYTDFSVAGVTKRADESMYINKRMMEYDGAYN